MPIVIRYADPERHRDTAKCRACHKQQAIEVDLNQKKLQWQCGQCRTVNHYFLEPNKVSDRQAKFELKTNKTLQS